MYYQIKVNSNKYIIINYNHYNIYYFIIGIYFDFFFLSTLIVKFLTVLKIVLS